MDSDTSQVLKHSLDVSKYKPIMPCEFLNKCLYFSILPMNSFENGPAIHFAFPNALSFNVKYPIIGTRSFGYSGKVTGVIRPKLQTNLEKVN